jgi:hypothetical protein
MHWRSLGGSWFLDGNFISFLGVFFQCTGAHWKDFRFDLLNYVPNPYASI